MKDGAEEISIASEGVAELGLLSNGAVKPSFICQLLLKGSNAIQYKQKSSPRSYKKKTLSLMKPK